MKFAPRNTLDAHLQDTSLGICRNLTAMPVALSFQEKVAAAVSKLQPKLPAIGYVLGTVMVLGSPFLVEKYWPQNTTTVIETVHVDLDKETGKPVVYTTLEPRK